MTEKKCKPLKQQIWDSFISNNNNTFFIHPYFESLECTYMNNLLDKWPNVLNVLPVWLQLQTAIQINFSLHTFPLPSEFFEKYEYPGFWSWRNTRNCSDKFCYKTKNHLRVYPTHKEPVIMVWEAIQPNLKANQQPSSQSYCQCFSSNTMLKFIIITELHDVFWLWKWDHVYSCSRCLLIYIKTFDSTDQNGSKLVYYPLFAGKWSPLSHWVSLCMRRIILHHKSQ